MGISMAAGDTRNNPFTQALAQGARPSIVVFAVVFGFVFSVATVYGGALARTGFFQEDPTNLLLPFLALFAVSAVMYLIIPAALNALAAGNSIGHHGKSSNEASETGNRRLAVLLAPRWDSRSVVPHALVMLAFWAVFLIALFPGAMNWDTYYQISQCYSDGTVWAIPWEQSGSVVDTRFSDHHPLFDTLLYGLFARGSDALFGTWNYGVFAFVVLQAAFTALSFVAAIAYLERFGVPLGLRGALYLFFCLIPIYPFYAAAMVKDSTSAPLFVLYLLMVIECARTRGTYFMEQDEAAEPTIRKPCPHLARNETTAIGEKQSPNLSPIERSSQRSKDSGGTMTQEPSSRVTGGIARGNKRAIALFVVVGLLLALTRKPGMYVVIASGIVFLFMYRKAWKAFVWQIASIVTVMMIVLPLAVFPLLDVIPGGKQEARGPLFQQTARYATLYPDDMTEDERAAIDRVMGSDDLAARYNPFNSDPVKFGYRYDTCTTSDLIAYYRVWLTQGLRHPDAYVEAMGVTAAPYLNLEGNLGILDSTGDEAHGGSPLVWQPQALDTLRSAVVGFYDTLGTIPIVSSLFRVGTYTFLVPALVFMALLMRKSKYAPVFVPIFLSLGVCLITPTFHARYALPLIYTAPLLVGLCFARNKE